MKKNVKNTKKQGKYSLPVRIGAGILAVGMILGAVLPAKAYDKMPSSVIVSETGYISSSAEDFEYLDKGFCIKSNDKEDITLHSGVIVIEKISGTDYQNGIIRHKNTWKKIYNEKSGPSTHKYNRRTPEDFQRRIEQFNRKGLLYL